MRALPPSDTVRLGDYFSTGFGSQFPPSYQTQSIDPEVLKKQHIRRFINQAVNIDPTEHGAIMLNFKQFVNNAALRSKRNEMLK